MPLIIQGTGTKTKPVFVEPTLPASTHVPNRRQAVEALSLIERLSPQHDNAALIDAELVTWEQAMDTLRRFILTR